MNPNPPKTNQAPLNHKIKRKNSKDPEKLTTVIDEGRHEQRLIIHKKPNPNNDSGQNPPLRLKRSLIIITKKRPKSI